MKDLEDISDKAYSHDSAKKCIYIDIDLDVYTDLYNEWDFSPQKKRDMDEDLFNYLIECSQEIPLKKRIVVRMHLPRELKNQEKEDNAIKGIRRYISYRIQKTAYYRKRAFRSMFGYGISGIAFLCMGIIIKNSFNGSALSSILYEGLIIGGWVLFWECFSIIFFKDQFLREQRAHLKRLLKTKVDFQYYPLPPQQDAGNSDLDGC